MKFLIIGSRGFIGGSFGRFVAQLGHEVIGTGRLSLPANNWPGCYLQSSLSSAEVAAAVREFAPDVLFNAAGPASVGESLIDPIGDFRGAAETCANVLEGVRNSGRNPLIVLASSAAVVGNPDLLPVNEDARVRPISPYGFHKAVCELLAREYAECFGLKIIVCRFFSVFGPAQRRLLIWELYQQLAGGEPTAWLAGTGTETRDFLYIDDLTAALLGLVENIETSDGESRTFNVASGTETSVMTLAEALRDLVAPEKEIRCHGNLRRNDPIRWWADVSRLQMLLPSWQPRPLKEALTLCAASWHETDRFSLQHGS